MSKDDFFIRRIVEGNKRFKAYLKLKQFGICIAIFVGGLFASHYLLIHLTKEQILTSVAISVIMAIICLFASYTKKPEFIFTVSLLSSIAVSSILLVL